MNEIKRENKYADKIYRTLKEKGAVGFGCQLAIQKGSLKHQTNDLRLDEFKSLHLTKENLKSNTPTIVL